MIITSVRFDDCADHMNKKPDLIIKNHKINTSEKYHSQNLTVGIVQMTARYNNTVGNCRKV